MNLIVLDKDFRPVAPINALQSLIWDRRYREAGTFELHAGVADFDAIRDGAYLYRDDREEFGIISVADIRRNKAGAKTCYAKGYFGEFMLDDRVLDRTQRLTGTPEDIARELVNRFFIETAEQPGDYEGRSLNYHLVLGAQSGEPQEEITWQGTGSPVGSALYALEADQGLSHRVIYDYEHDHLEFEVYKGQDRNALLSDQYGNLTETSYHRDSTDAPNVVFIAGAGEGKSRKVYRLDMREDAGERAREMYVDARDLQQDFIGDDGQSYHYDDEDYDALLEYRGRQKVAEHKAQERFEAQVDARGNLVYRVDFDLGDYCTARIDGVTLEKQITGIRETYEAGKETIEVTLGDYGATSIQAFVQRQAQINSAPGGAGGSGVGDLGQLETEDKASLVGAVNEVKDEIGDLGKLETEAKDSLVDAINEALGGIGDLSGLETDAKDSVVDAVNEVKDEMGDLGGLKTKNKDSLVDAINELAEGGGGGSGTDSRIGDLADLTTDAKDTVVDAINEVAKTASTAATRANTVNTNVGNPLIVPGRYRGASLSESVKNMANAIPPMPIVLDIPKNFTGKITEDVFTTPQRSISVAYTYEDPDTGEEIAASFTPRSANYQLFPGGRIWAFARPFGTDASTGFPKFGPIKVVDPIEMRVTYPAAADAGYSTELQFQTLVWLWGPVYEETENVYNETTRENITLVKTAGFIPVAAPNGQYFKVPDINTNNTEAMARGFSATIRPAYGNARFGGGGPPQIRSGRVPYIGGNGRAAGTYNIAALWANNNAGGSGERRIVLGFTYNEGAAYPEPQYSLTKIGTLASNGTAGLIKFEGWL